MLRASNLQSQLKWQISTPATISDVLRVHDWSYIRKIQYACSQINTNAENNTGISHLDGDTAVSNQSFIASLHGAGAVCNAVHLVVNGTTRTLCVIDQHSFVEKSSADYLRTQKRYESIALSLLPTIDPWPVQVSIVRIFLVLSFFLQQEVGEESTCLSHSSEKRAIITWLWLARCPTTIQCQTHHDRPPTRTNKSSKANPS